MADFGKPCMALYKVTDPCQYTRLFNRHRLTKNIFPKASSPLPSDDVKNVYLNKRVLHNKCYVILYKRWHHSELFTHTHMAAELVVNDQDTWLKPGGRGAGLEPDGKIAGLKPWGRTDEVKANSTATNVQVGVRTAKPKTDSQEPSRYTCCVWESGDKPTGDAQHPKTVGLLWLHRGSRWWPQWFSRD